MDLSMYDHYRTAEGDIELHPEELVDALLSLFLGTTNLNITVKVESLQYPGQYHYLTFNRVHLSETPPAPMEMSLRLQGQREEMINSIEAEWGNLEGEDNTEDVFYPDATDIVRRSPFITIPEGMPFDQL
ncbi:hypothetical protein CJU90_3633 [Yarrowia sp. C11]|nr:hypothetical protein CJU90_3633 [Yarrowia sp. C11]